jgi:microsomal dipeptidase-like Zn-dependent dipeptidase
MAIQLSPLSMLLIISSISLTFIGWDHVGLGSDFYGNLQDPIELGTFPSIQS